MPILLKNKIEAINDRIGFLTMRKILGQTCGVTATGNQLFINKFESAEVEKPNLITSIDKFWNDLRFGGKERINQVFKFKNESKLNSMHTYLSSLNADMSHSFNSIFPYPIDKSLLNKLDISQVFTSYDTFQYNGNTLSAAVFCSKAYYTSTNELNLNHLSSEGRELRGNGAQFYYKKKDTAQCYNVVILDYKTKSIIISADMSVLPKTEGILQIERLKKHIQTTSLIELNTPHNQSGVIEPLYNNPDGRISALSFMTTDGNTSDLKLKTSQQCLRQDIYHQSGEQAVAVLPKFKLGKIWDVKLANEIFNPISILLQGKRRMLDNGESLSEIITSNCTSLTETIFLFHKLDEVDSGN